MGTCIAYFTKEGSTKIAAEYLAEKLNAHIIKLDDTTKYKGFIGFMKGGFKASTSGKANLDTSIYEQIEKHDRIVLATPVWAGKTTPAINAVLENVNFTGKEVYVVTCQADPKFGDEDARRSFYESVITDKGGRFIDLFSLAGTAPGKGPRDRNELIAQVDKKIILK